MCAYDPLDLKNHDDGWTVVPAIDVSPQELPRITIYVNGRRAEVDDRPHSFREVLMLAGQVSSPYVAYGDRGESSGRMLPGDVLAICDGMKFRVYPESS